MDVIQENIEFAGDEDHSSEDDKESQPSLETEGWTSDEDVDETYNENCDDDQGKSRTKYEHGILPYT